MLVTLIASTVYLFMWAGDGNYKLYACQKDGTNRIKSCQYVGIVSPESMCSYNQGQPEDGV